MNRFGPDVSAEGAAFIHPSACLYGAIRIGPCASVWANAVIRAEIHAVEIGPHTNIQDFVMIHVGFADGTRIGSHCSIAHHATVHGCTIGDNCLVGINATIMDGSRIGDNCIIAGGAFIKENTTVPENSVVAGVPARILRTRNSYVANRLNAFAYYWNALGYAQGDHRIWASAAYRAAEEEERRRLELEFGARYNSLG